MRRLLITILVLITVVTGCQWQTSEQPPDSSPIEDPSQIIPPDSPKLPKERGRVVTVGLPGFEEEIPMDRLTHEWLQIEFDKRLQVSVGADILHFTHPKDPVTFTVERIQGKEKIDSERTALEEKNYELANVFPLESGGEAFIYYLYDEREQVELYMLEQNQQVVLVRFQFHETVADRYQFVFDHMLDSIVLLNPDERTEDVGEDEVSIGQVAEQ